MNFLKSFLICLSCLLPLTSGESTSDMPVEDVIDSTVHQETINSTKFSIDCYKAIFNEKENIVASPISLRILLSILYHTTTGDSESQLREKIYLANKHDTEISHRLALNHFMESHNLKIINKIYVRYGSIVRDNFKTIINEYRSSVEPIDFIKRKESSNLINEWVENETDGLINDLVTEDIFNDDMSLFLVNTIYFKAQWKHPFSSNAVYKSEFIDINGKSSIINIMSTSDLYKIARMENMKATVIEIPYITHSNFVFWLLLPNEDSSIMELQKLFNYDTINDISKSFIEQTVELSLPIFETETAVDAVKILREMGLTAIFDKYEVDMLENFDHLRVDAAKQKSKIIVNTDGTEVSSASYIEFIIRSGKPHFIVNRPFIYTILMADTKEPVFIGHYSKPNESE